MNKLKIVVTIAISIVILYVVLWFQLLPKSVRHDLAINGFGQNRYHNLEFEKSLDKNVNKALKLNGFLMPYKTIGNPMASEICNELIEKGGYQHTNALYYFLNHENEIVYKVRN